MSIRELAETLIELIKTYPKYAKLAENVKLVTVKSGDYYGEGYQDIQTRVPSIRNAEQYLGWKPTTDLKTALRKTLDYHLGQAVERTERIVRSQNGSAFVTSLSFKERAGVRMRPA